MGVLTIPPATPALVLFGRDQAGKPHASWFDAASAELATKAAGLMSMRAVPVESDVLRDVAASLPRGRLFSSGRAFTPFIKGKLYERLEAATRDAPGSEPTGTIAAGDEQPGPVPSGEPTAAPTDAGEVPSDTAAELPADHPAPAGVTELEAAKPATASAVLPAAAAPAKPQPKPSPRPSRVEDIAPGSTVLATTGPAEGWYEAKVIGTNGSTFTLKWVDYGEPSFVRRGNELGFLPRLPG